MSYEPNPSPSELDGSSPFESKSSEGKFASLTAGLLARKGEAEPALEPFAHARVAGASARQMGPGERHALDRKDDKRFVRSPDAPPARLEDAARLKPGPRAVEEKRFAENCPREKIALSPKRAAVTFRMSVHDFLRLKLASAELERSSQDIIIDAIEAYLDVHNVQRLDDCKCLKAAGDACSAKAAE